MEKRVMFIIATVMLLIIGSAKLMSQERDSTIVDYLHGTSNEKVNIVQPEGLNERLMPDELEEETHQSSSGKMVGFRIQVFSDNNHRTAKSEAMIKERNITSRFPLIKTYLTYKAPAWRLRVGDFKTQEEAHEMMNQIKKAFPGYSREVIIVRDRINID
ncbi:MAG: SPOR domain-containing protein [Muribaculaceae bacterium]|nr:SPOR domain-containing protein [Muribaculaceae bacterium]